MYDADSEHAIPQVDVLDVHAVRNSGGSDLVIVVSSPLGSDERSQRRLLAKLENYLRFIRSVEYRDEYGKATPESSSILVRIHPHSDATIFELLERCKPWVAENGTQLVVEAL